MTFDGVSVDLDDFVETIDVTLVGLAHPYVVALVRWGVDNS